MAGDALRRRIVVLVEGRREADALGRPPLPVDHTGAPGRSELGEPLRPPIDRATAHEGHQQIVELVGVPRARPHLLEHFGERCRIERRQLGGRHGQPVRSRDPEATTQGDCPGAALFEWRSVQKGVRTPGQDPVGQRRRFCRLDEMHVDLSRLDVGQQRDQALGVECLGQTVGDGLSDQHVVGDADRPGTRVLLTGRQGGPGGRQQVVCVHALKVDRAASAAPRPRNDQRPVAVPTPARPEHRMRKDRLGHNVGRGPAREHRRHLLEREAVLGPQGEGDGVVVRRRLELEVERDTEPLAQGQAERTVDPTTVRGMHHQLRSFGVVEEPLDDEPLAGREDAAQGVAPGRQVGHHLLGHGC